MPTKNVSFRPVGQLPRIDILSIFAEFAGVVAISSPLADMSASGPTGAPPPTSTNELPATSPSVPAGPPNPLPPHIARKVGEYLHAHGYRASEAALRAEQQAASVTASANVPTQPQLALDEAEVDDDLKGVLMMLKGGSAAGVSDAGRYEESYRELRDWVDGSLDLYKAELHGVLYPVMVHCFLEMVRRESPEGARNFLNTCSAEFSDEASAISAPGIREELVSLAGVSLKQHLDENEAACLFLKNRYELHLSSYAFELLISFLSDDPRRAVVLRIINQRCRVLLDAAADRAARAGALALRRDQAGSGGFVSTKEKDSCIQHHQVLWGRLLPSLYIISDEEAAAVAAPASSRGGKTAAASSTGADPGGKKDGRAGKGSSDGAVAGGSMAGAVGDAGKKSVGGDGGSVPNADGKGDAMELDVEDDKPHVRADGTLSESLIPLKRYRVGAPGLETDDDIKSRAPLGNVVPLVPEDSGGDSGTGTMDATATVAASRIVDPASPGSDSSAWVLPSVLCYTYTNTRNDGLNCSAVSPDGSQVVAGFGDSSLRIWDAKASGTAGAGAGGFGGPAARLVGHSGPVYSVDWTNCTRFVLSGSEDGTVRLWSALTHADLVAYRGHNYPVWSVGFSPLDHYFASGSHDRSARVWVTDRVYPLRILSGHLADVDVVRWHPNCNYVATGSSDRTARLWDLRDGRCVRVFAHQSGSIQSLAFSPSGRILAVAGEACNIDLWDIAMGKRLASLKGHTGTIWSLDYSCDGSVLASGGADNSVRLWRASDGALCDVSDASGTPALDADSNGGFVGSRPLGKRSRGSGLGAKSSGVSAKSAALLATLRTKRTPVHLVHFTRRNLLIAAGSYTP